MQPPILINEPHLQQGLAHCWQDPQGRPKAWGCQLIEDVRWTSIDRAVLLELEAVAPELHEEADDHVRMASPDLCEPARLGMVDERGLDRQVRTMTQGRRQTL